MFGRSGWGKKGAGKNPADYEALQAESATTEFLKKNPSREGMFALIRAHYPQTYQAINHANYMIPNLQIEVRPTFTKTDLDVVVWHPAVTDGAGKPSSIWNHTIGISRSEQDRKGWDRQNVDDLNTRLIVGAKLAVKGKGLDGEVDHDKLLPTPLAHSLGNSSRPSDGPMSPGEKLNVG